MFLLVELMLHLEVTLDLTLFFFLHANVTYYPAIDLSNLNERGNSRRYFPKQWMKCVIEERGELVNWNVHLNKVTIFISKQRSEES